VESLRDDHTNFQPFVLGLRAAHDTEVAERAIGLKLKKIRPWSSHVA
jgi:hypothetical protein